MENFDDFASVYDLIFGKGTSDIKFYKKEARKVKGKVLEIACGTGRIYLELLKDGVDAYGIDISEKMLRVLKSKAKKLGFRPNVRKANMQNFHFQEKFELIIIPYRSFLHNLTIDEQIRTLTNVRKHLAPGGKLMLNFFSPNVNWKNYKPGKKEIGKVKTPKALFRSIRIPCSLTNRIKSSR